MSFDVDTTEAHERRIVRCRSCNARIVWLIMPSGKKNPADADTVESGDELFEWGKHVSHFSSCPQADQWRKRR